MSTPPIDIWPKSVAEAIQLQQQLRQRVVLKKTYPNFKTFAGVDVSHDTNDISHAAIVVVDGTTLKPLESVTVSAPTRFPYVPGLLSFREIPVILAALKKLKRTPDLLMVDGQGIAHPRRLGIAAHLGVLTDLPALGVAKSRLTGRYKEPGSAKGSHTPLTAGGEHIGTVLRSKEKCLPLFISPGHKMDQAQALEVTLRCLTRYRLPEPTRLADKLSKQRD
ncbi:MAG: deoxyribonuclease V [Alphaproteobacteria bacterium]|nr:deoxyribonuclease V [Alphaproteobacteria bacterium]